MNLEPVRASSPYEHRRSLFQSTAATFKTIEDIFTQSSNQLVQITEELIKVNSDLDLLSHLITQAKEGQFQGNAAIAWEKVCQFYNPDAHQAFRSEIIHELSNRQQNLDEQRVNAKSLLNETVADLQHWLREEVSVTGIDVQALLQSLEKFTDSNSSLSESLKRFLQLSQEFIDTIHDPRYRRAMLVAKHIDHPWCEASLPSSPSRPAKISTPKITNPLLKDCWEALLRGDEGGVPLALLSKSAKAAAQQLYCDPHKITSALELLPAWSRPPIARMVDGIMLSLKLTEYESRALFRESFVKIKKEISEVPFHPLFLFPEEISKRISVLNELGLDTQSSLAQPWLVWILGTNKNFEIMIKSVAHLRALQYFQGLGFAEQQEILVQCTTPNAVKTFIKQYEKALTDEPERGKQQLEALDYLLKTPEFQSIPNEMIRGEAARLVVFGFLSYREPLLFYAKLMIEESLEANKQPAFKNFNVLVRHLASIGVLDIALEAPHIVCRIDPEWAQGATSLFQSLGFDVACLTKGTRRLFLIFLMQQFKAMVQSNDSIVGSALPELIQKSQITFQRSELLGQEQISMQLSAQFIRPTIFSQSYFKSLSTQFVRHLSALRDFWRLFSAFVQTVPSEAGKELISEVQGKGRTNIEELILKAERHMKGKSDIALIEAMSSLYLLNEGGVSPLTLNILILEMLISELPDV